jgi:hypothetical protein
MSTTTEANRITGSCLCGAVTFEMNDEFQEFHLCHCKQCQKISGSSNVANIFTAADNISWTQGEDLIKRYDHPGRGFTTAFCTECGSGLPFVTQSGKILIVPAGSLDEEPSITPNDNIFWHERMSWLEESREAKTFEGFPK